MGLLLKFTKVYKVPILFIFVTLISISIFTYNFFFDQVTYKTEIVLKNNANLNEIPGFYCNPSNKQFKFTCNVSYFLLGQYNITSDLNSYLNCSYSPAQCPIGTSNFFLLENYLIYVKESFKKNIPQIQDVKLIDGINNIQLVFVDLIKGEDFLISNKVNQNIGDLNKFLNLEFGKSFKIFLNEFSNNSKIKIKNLNQFNESLFVNNSNLINYVRVFNSIYEIYLNNLINNMSQTQNFKLYDYEIHKITNHFYKRPLLTKSQFFVFSILLSFWLTVLLYFYKKPKLTKN